MSMANKALLQRFFTEVCEQGNLHGADEIVAVDYVNHHPAPGEAPGREGLKAYVAYLRRAFADLHIEIEDQVGEGDKVATRFTVSFVQQGEFAGIPSTGKHATVTAISIHRISNGLLQENWLSWDALAMLRQLSTAHAVRPSV